MSGSSAHGIHACSFKLLTHVAHLGMGVIKLLLEHLILLPEFPVPIIEVALAALSDLLELLLAEGEFKVFHLEAIINTADLDLHGITSLLLLKILLYDSPLYYISEIM